MNAARTALQELAGSLLPKDGGPMIFDGLIFMAEYILALDMAEGLPPRERFCAGSVRDVNTGCCHECDVMDNGRKIFTVSIPWDTKVGAGTLATKIAQGVAGLANQIAAAQPPLPDGEWEIAVFDVRKGDLILYDNPLRWEVAEDSDIGCSVNQYTCVARRKEKATP